MKKDRQSELVENCRHVVISLCRLSHYISYQCTNNSNIEHVTSFILQPYHMSAAALNAFHNIWLKHATNNKELTLDVNNHPLPRTAEAEVHVYTCAVLYVYECRHSSMYYWKS